MKSELYVRVLGSGRSLGIRCDISLEREREMNISCYEDVGEVPVFGSQEVSPRGEAEMASSEEENTGKGQGKGGFSPDGPAMRAGV